MKLFRRRETPLAQTIPRSDQPLIETLEARTLLAATLPDGFEQTVWSRGFTVPTAQEFAPDGRLFVTEKAGAVRVVSAKGKLRDEPFVTVPADTFVDRGLVSIAIDPDFDENGFVYLYYTIRRDGEAFNRLSRFKTDDDNPNVAADGSERVLLESPMDSALHTGGMMHFGADGMLYLGIGDSGSGGRAQRLDDIRGKILRLDVSNFPDSIIPDDNPFADRKRARKEIWALGFRNPFSGGIDPVSGHVFVNDVGHESFEEVNRVRKGRNYGWPIAEGPSTDESFVNPVYSYPKNNVGAAVTGGMVYRGDAIPAEYRGNYYFADYLRGWIKRLDLDSRKVTDFATGAEGPLDLDVGPDGNIYYLSAFGNGFTGENRPVYRISFVDGDNRAPQAVASAKVTSGALPLKVKFRGAKSSDPDGDELRYVWNFGDGSKKVIGPNPTHTFKSKGRYKVRLTVRDGKGGVDRSDPITVLAGFSAPRAKISLPKGSLKYVAGNRISFAGIGRDAEDGKLRKQQFEWSVVFVHDDHTHEFKPSIPGVSRSAFRTATTGETDPNQGYRITLTVTDSDGLRDSDSVLVRPRKTDVTVRTNVRGLKFAVDGHEYRTSTTFVGVAGLERELAAPNTQTVRGRKYVFDSWSDGGDATHIARTPARDTVYVARYVKAGAGEKKAAGPVARANPRTIRMPLSLGEVAAGVIRGRVYFVGESDSATASYNTRNGQFNTRLAKRPYPGHHHGAEVYRGRLYLIGGLGSGAAKVQIYDPASDTWTLGADMPFAAGSVSTALIRGKVYVAGGIVGSKTTDLVARYNPSKDAWKMLAPMPAGRNHAASGTDGKRFYIFGGRGPGSGDANFVANGFDTVQIYDPAANRWKTGKPLPVGRGGMGKAVFAKGRFYVMGGETATGRGANRHEVYDRVDIYDPRTGKWRRGRDLTTARHGIFPVVHNGRIYLPGGGIRAGGSQSDILEIYRL